MIKLVIYISISLALIYWALATTHHPQLETLGKGEHRFYSPEQISSPYITHIINVGFGFIHFTCSTKAPYVRTLFTQIDGESLTLQGITAVQVFRKLNHRKVATQHSNVMRIYYGYSSRTRTFITHNNQRINLQVAKRGNNVTVGWPVIMSGF